MSTAEGIAVDFSAKPRALYTLGCVTGSILSYYCRSLFYQQMSYSYKGCDEKLFNHPWFGTLVMAFGMSICLIIYMIHRHFVPSIGLSITKIPLSHYLFAALPSLCDMFYSLFYSFSIIQSSGEISVALRYFEFFFVVIMHKVIFKPKYYPYMWTSCAIVLTGIIFVTVSVILEENSASLKSWEFYFVVICQIFAQFCHAMKSIFEQKLVHENELSPWWVAGIEGVYQMLIMFFVVNPLTYCIPTSSSFVSLREDFCESITMVCHSSKLLGLFAVYLPIVCTYNGCLVGTIMTSNCVSYTLMEMIGTSIAWIIDIVIYHGFDGYFILPAYNGYKYGVEWKKLSYLRLAGSLIYFFGGMIFMKLIRFKCFEYESPNVSLIQMRKFDESNEEIPVV